MTTYQDRVRQELSELKEKIEKLSAFQGTVFYTTLDKVDQNLLQEQKWHMGDYADVLQLRIDRFSA